MADEKQGKDKKTALGLDENVEALLCYALGWVTGIIFLLLEPKNKVIKFHAVQSIGVFLAMTILMKALLFVPILGWLLIPFVGLAGFILWIILMVKAYNGEKYKLPVIGDIAEKQVNG